MHNGDLEDAIADEMPRNSVGSAIIVQGRKTSKAKALCHQMAFCSTRSSTDRLRHVQNIPCFGPNASTGEPDSWSGSTTSCNNITLGPTLHVGNPVALLIQCNALVVLAVAQVNQLQFASHSNLDEVAVHLLANPTAKVNCQILHLVPATVKDDPTCMHDLSQNNSLRLDLPWVFWNSWHRAWYRLVCLEGLQLASLLCSCSLDQTTLHCSFLSCSGDK